MRVVSPPSAYPSPLTAMADHRRSAATDHPRNSRLLTGSHATIYAEIIGFGFSSDAGHITNPSPRSRLAMRQAIAYANANPKKSATSTPTVTGSLRSTTSPSRRHPPGLRLSCLHNSVSSHYNPPLPQTPRSQREPSKLSHHHRPQKNLLTATPSFTTIDPAINLDVSLATPANAAPKLASHSLASVVSTRSWLSAPSNQTTNYICHLPVPLSWATLGMNEECSSSPALLCCSRRLSRPMPD